MICRRATTYLNRNDRVVLNPGSDLCLSETGNGRGNCVSPADGCLEANRFPARLFVQRIKPPERAIASACERRPAERSMFTLE
jgi:hypothetical protein